MLRKQEVKEVEMLLKETTLSLGNIAKRVGISRGSVTRIKNGEYNPVYVRSGVEKKPPPTMTGDVGRCPECGRKVRLPCHACFVEALVKV